MLAATLLCLASLTQAGPERSGVIRGVVIEKGTHRPIAGVSVRSSDEPDAPTVTTNERGEFDRLPVGKGNPVPFDGQPGPSVRVRAEDDRAWPWEIVEHVALVRNSPGYQPKQAIEALYQRAETRWKGDNPGATLVVECPPIGAIEVVLRGPDGRPLRERPILVEPMLDFPVPGPTAIRFSGRTDRAGTFRLQSFEGVSQLGVHVPGIGFGFTGRIDVIGDKVARPALPPLARFARVEGRLAPALRAPGTKVALLPGHSHEAVGATAPSDEQGHFVLHDVVPGMYHIAVWKDGRNVRITYREVDVRPGQVLAGVMLKPPPAPTPEVRNSAERTLRQLNGDRNNTITWVEGIIRDEKGQPLAGAAVYLHFHHRGALRVYEQVKKTTTDDRGWYKFEGPLYPSMGRLMVVAAVQGRPPAIAYAPGPDASLEEDELKPVRLDVILAPTSAGASARVTLTHDGKKASGVVAQLSVEGTVALSDPITVGAAHGVERDEVQALVAPTATTGRDGVARFEHLFPGTFELAALARPNPRLLLQRGWGRDATRRLRIAEGVTVPAGGTIQITVALDRQPSTVRFRVLKPDGSPVVAQCVALSFGLGEPSTMTSFMVDHQGIGSHAFDSPGLWTVDVRFRDADVTSFPVREEPFYQAAALIPVSPGLDLDDPVTLRAVKRDRGAIRARLIDANGKPAAGTVMIVDNARGPVLHAGTVDAKGWVHFADLLSGKYRLRGAVQGRMPAPRLGGSSARINDATLEGLSTVFDREVTVDSGVETSVELREERVGYVRATIRAPAGRMPSEFTASFKSNVSDNSVWSFVFDPNDGSYLFGPARGGQCAIDIWEKTDDGQRPARGARPVVVEPGHIVRVEVEPDPSPRRPNRPRSSRHALLGMAGISLIDSGPDRFAATVLLADGLTPAFGARALYIPPGEREASVEGIADGSGRLTWKPRWSFSQPSEAGEGPEPVKEPTVVAWMPGLAGPVVAVPEPEKPLRLVLPAPAGVAGRVTLGGRGIDGRNARVRVVAAAEGRGALAIAFGREVTADPDGRFQFAGLAPGRYVVQAARDNIWLSKSVALVVESGKEAAPIDLDIPEPGATIALDLVDDRDRPVAGRSLSIVRPEGPLASALPMRYRTDERGAAIVRGLETGPQSLIADGDPRPRTFTVSPARPGLSPQAIRIGINHSTP